MNELLKKRLVGAILLVGSVVIVLAFLFGGQGNQDSLQAEKPNRAHQSDTAEGESVHKTSPEVKTHAAPPGTSARTRPKTAQKHERPANHPEHTATRKDTGSLSQPQSGSQSKGTGAAGSPPQNAANANPATQRRPRPVNTPTPSPGSGAGSAEGEWVIQTASFKTRQRAVTLKRQLSKKGVEAFVAKGTVSGHSVYRVRVGPVSGVAARDRMTQRLRKKLGHDVLILKHN